MQSSISIHKKPPTRATIPAEEKLLVSRGEAAQLLSISQRGLDYLIANRKLPTRRIGGRVLVPVADLRRYAGGDHPSASSHRDASSSNLLRKRTLARIDDL